MMTNYDIRGFLYLKHNKTGEHKENSDEHTANCWQVTVNVYLKYLLWWKIYNNQIECDHRYDYSASCSLCTHRFNRNDMIKSLSTLYSNLEETSRRRRSRRHVECCYRLWWGFSLLHRHLFDYVGERKKTTQKEKKKKKQNATLSRSSPGSVAGYASTLCSFDWHSGHQEKGEYGSVPWRLGWTMAHW